jgi:predicted RNA-binding protein with RPS1 domain
VKCLDVIPEDGKLVVSQRLAHADTVPRLQAGQLVPATVTYIRPYGVFLELEGGLSGLLHVSQVSSGRVEDLGALFRVGDPVRALVLQADGAAGRIALTTIPLERRPGDMLRNCTEVFEQAEATLREMRDQAQQQQQQLEREGEGALQPQENSNGWIEAFSKNKEEKKDRMAPLTGTAAGVTAPAPAPAPALEIPATPTRARTRASPRASKSYARAESAASLRATTKTKEKAKANSASASASASDPTPISHPGYPGYPEDPKRSVSRKRPAVATAARAAGSETEAGPRRQTRTRTRASPEKEMLPNSIDETIQSILASIAVE